LLCLNRIIKPQIPLEEFLKFTADLGIKYVEVRNDFTDKGVLDGLSDAALQRAFKDTGIKALTINALYPFEDVKILKENIEKLKGLIAEAKRINCPQIVLCPLNDANDKRSAAQRADELATALTAYGPLFAETKMIGLIEPLGFPICALRTKKAALEGIANCKYPESYKLLHDTFHHYRVVNPSFSQSRPPLSTFQVFSQARPRQRPLTKTGYWLPRMILWITVARLQLC